MARTRNTGSRGRSPVQKKPGSRGGLPVKKNNSGVIDALPMEEIDFGPSKLELWTKKGAIFILVCVAAATLGSIFSLIARAF